MTEAYNTLIRPESCQEYDRQLAEPQTAADSAKSDTQYLARQNFVRGSRCWSAGTTPKPCASWRTPRAWTGTWPSTTWSWGSCWRATRASARRPSATSSAPPSLDPAATAAYLALGQIYARAGRTPHAAFMFREVLRWDPGTRRPAQLAELGPVGTRPRAQRGRPVFTGG